jgi:hypothetical protein
MEYLIMHNVFSYFCFVEKDFGVVGIREFLPEDDMSDRGLEIIAKTLRDLRTVELTPRHFRRLVVEDDGNVIVFMGCLDLPKELLQYRTEERVVIEKYRRKALKAIGFGIMVLDSKPFECISWMEGPWERDEGIEKMIQDEPISRPAPGQKLPRRNDPCVCGSGKKFKKCCIQKFKDSV